jgi:acyl-coenzyme A synthetase/AMP-(fatty) acid ligase/acyl carrier protein
MRAHRATLPRIGSDTVDYSIANVIARQRVSHLQCTPSLAEMMIQDRATSAALKSLSTVLLGGEALSTSLVEKLPESLQILNMYGPTETTVWSAAHEVERGESPIPIGRPIANTQIYILDRQQRPVPVGVVGELYIGGDGVGRGYWNLPVLTAERFVEDPFTQGHQRRVYRTGDLARYRPAGLVEFLGRSDQQVKLRGFRVELGEIEVVMRRHPVVRECAVKVWEPAPGDKRLVGYVVAVPSRTIDAEALRQFLADALPDYMVPSLFVPLEELPLTPNGKLDRRALPDPKEAPAAAAPAGYRAPGTELERTVARIWREHLRIERVGRHDNFFDLGGHSLLLVQVQSRLQEALGRELSITALFQFPTVSSLAGYLAAGRASEPSFDRARSRARRQQAAFNHEKEGITA